MPPAQSAGGALFGGPGGRQPLRRGAQKSAEAPQKTAFCSCLQLSALFHRCCCTLSRGRQCK
eukprot:15446009-Alexandrium_andersonii.AAC.1